MEYCGRQEKTGRRTEGINLAINSSDKATEGRRRIFNLPCSTDGVSWGKRDHRTPLGQMGVEGRAYRPLSLERLLSAHVLY